MFATELTTWGNPDLRLIHALLRHRIDRADARMYPRQMSARNRGYDLFGGQTVNIVVFTEDRNPQSQP